MLKFIIFLLISSSVLAQQNEPNTSSIDLLFLQLQFRFEDANDQTRTNHQYQAYGLGWQQSFFRAEIEYSQYYDSTGNSALKIEQTVQELSLGLGYELYKFTDIERSLSLAAYANVWLGQTQTTIDTTLLSVQNTLKSDKENVLGFGASLVGRIKYFILETDFKMLNSKNMSPQTIPVVGIKLGASIPY